VDAIAKRTQALGVWDENSGPLATSHNPSVDTDHLVIDPVTGRADKECDQLSGVLGLAEPFDRRLRRQAGCRVPV
jgi:hypothetical protein